MRSWDQPCVWEGIEAGLDRGRSRARVNTMTALWGFTGRNGVRWPFRVALNWTKLTKSSCPNVTVTGLWDGKWPQASSSVRLRQSLMGLAAEDRLLTACSVTGATSPHWWASEWHVVVCTSWLSSSLHPSLTRLVICSSPYFFPELLQQGPSLSLCLLSSAFFNPFSTLLCDHLSKYRYNHAILLLTTIQGHLITCGIRNLDLHPGCTLALKNYVELMLGFHMPSVSLSVGCLLPWTWLFASLTPLTLSFQTHVLYETSTILLA